MEDKDIRKDANRDLMHHPEHMCSLRLNSCGADEAKGEGKPSRQTRVPAICTPLFSGT